ncbi:hypothetical protein Taro_010962 [Colocasia esculenta]|uniref:Uncharacterized protein n=1 Tax=Colocasia esculenta TaxID=4460 RepID=A0A843U9Q8_COLES|nr:hypothetical protein [Colocasia esculenta]
MKNRQENTRELERGRRGKKRKREGEWGRMGRSLGFKPTAPKTRWVVMAIPDGTPKRQSNLEDRKIKHDG